MAATARSSHRCSRTSRTYSHSQVRTAQFWRNSAQFCAILAQSFSDPSSSTATADGRCVLAAGVDHKVSLFVPKPEADRPAAAALAGLGHAPLAKWTLASSRRPHTHDVRALAVRTGGGGGGGSVVVSAGIDTQASPADPATPNARSPRPAAHKARSLRPAAHTPDLTSR